MNWGAMQEAMRVAVCAAVGCPLEQCHWVHARPAAAWINFPMVQLQLRSPRTVGVDETRYRTVEDRYQESQEGPREFILEIRIETETQVPGIDTWQLSSQMRARLRKPSILAVFQNAGMGIGAIAQTNYAGYQSDSRMISASITEVTMLAAETDSDTLSSSDYFSHVDLEGFDSRKVIPPMPPDPDEEET